MLRKWTALIVTAVLVTAAVAPALHAVTPEQIQSAIDQGVEWLVSQQKPDGSWYLVDPWQAVGTTGFAVVKLTDYALEQGYASPVDPAYAYAGNVADGLTSLLQHATSCGPGICFRHDPGSIGHETYFTGIAMMALASARCPNEVVSVGNPDVDGLTYKQILQLAVDYFAWAQNGDGGWRYWSTNEPSDNSNTGYATLGLRYAESVGCVIPDALKAGLSSYVDFIQSPDGGSGYTGPGDWENVLKTGNLLFEMAFVGDTTATPRVQEALSYIATHWNDPNQDPGWRIHYQAMYCLMKGLESLSIETIMVGATEVDWYEEFANAILSTQNADGSWPPDNWGDELMATEWALLTLERVAPPPPIVIDIKPGSFPNSINPDQKGTTPVAILSTEEFIAPELVDPSTLTFGRIGDEASLAYRGKNKAKPQCSAEDVNGDGLPDLVAHFVTALAGFEDGDEFGYLKGVLYDGTEFMACDSVRIVPPSSGPKEVSESRLLSENLEIQVAPNPIRDVHTAHFTILGPMAEAVTRTWVQIYDLSGKLVWEEDAAGTQIDWHTNTLAGEYLANGIYIYRVLVSMDGNWSVAKLATFAVSR